MRLGKHEKKILWILRTWASVNPEWTWNPGTSYLRELAKPEHIADFEQGNRVPVWILRRDVACGKTVLARALKTLGAKGLIIAYGADLDTVGEPLTYITKFVGITAKGKTLMHFGNLTKLAFSCSKEETA